MVGKYMWKIDLLSQHTRCLSHMPLRFFLGKHYSTASQGACRSDFSLHSGVCPGDEQGIAEVSQKVERGDNDEDSCFSTSHPRRIQPTSRHRASLCDYFSMCEIIRVIICKHFDGFSLKACSFQSGLQISKTHFLAIVACGT